MIPKLLGEIRYQLAVRLVDASMPLARAGMRFAVETYAERARRAAR